ncbi:MAG TPA: DUF1003 domain-containing protein [Chthoniobacterales bacterium]|jgi:uncharacterized membrane protein
MNQDERGQTFAGRSEMTAIVERNIDALLERRKATDQSRPWQEKIADGVTAFAGNMKFVWLHLCLYGGWIAINSGLLGLPRFDPSFVILAMIASVESIFLSTFILISQNRMMALADKRADLDLQVSLLAEHEITQLVRLVGEIARKLEIEKGHDPALAELERDVPPEKVLDSIERQSARSS